ncbi:MAG: c-type cytochrome [Myxococcota bacterium]|nr:c-type cytochrome [Myxococcota bacterium]
MNQPTPFIYALTGLIVLGCGHGVADEQSSNPVAATGQFPGADYAGKSDVFGRALVGPAAPYPADNTLAAREDQLRSHMGERRALGWQIAARILEPVPLLGLAQRAPETLESFTTLDDVPTLPRWQSWYGVDDFRRMFRRAYGEMDAGERTKRSAIPEDVIAEAVAWNAAAQERSERWPLDRFIRHVNALGDCPEGLRPDACARLVQSKFSGGAGGNARITYSPAAVEHFLRNYASLDACEERLNALGIDVDPVDESANFSACFAEEFPTDAVLMKAHWVRADFGRKVPVYDTDAERLTRLLSPDKSGDWGTGQREANPTPDEIYTIRLRNGDTYRLAGLHIMTKELRHWVWVTLWWSDKPDIDFGADRPVAFDGLDAVWQNYKMNVVVDYEELDPNPAQWFEEYPTLADAINAVRGPLTWASNPYIEHGRGNAKTNCIGCHQHGGSKVGHDLNGDGIADAFDLDQVITDERNFPSNGRRQLRTLFPADYLWSTQRMDNLSAVILRELRHYDRVDSESIKARAATVTEISGDAMHGGTIFLNHCTGCHGREGKKTAITPSLFDRVSSLSRDQRAEVLLNGKGGMPAWAQLTNEELADILAYLDATFAP